MGERQLSHENKCEFVKFRQHIHLVFENLRIRKNLAKKMLRKLARNCELAIQFKGPEKSCEFASEKLRISIYLAVPFKCDNE